MKIDMSFLAVFLFIGTDLLARASIQGVEPALVSTAIEYGSAGVMHIKVGESEQEIYLNRCPLVISSTTVFVNHRSTIGVSLDSIGDTND